jgi:hypothetical protein
MATKTLTMEIPVAEAAKYAAGIAGYLAKIDRSLERSRKRQAEIAKLKVRTRATLAELKALR